MIVCVYVPHSEHEKVLCEGEMELLRVILNEARRREPTTSTLEEDFNLEFRPPRDEDGSGGSEREWVICTVRCVGVRGKVLMRKLYVARVETERLEEAAELHSGAENFGVWIWHLNDERMRGWSHLAQLVLFCPFLQRSQMVLTKFLCAGMRRSAQDTAEVGASSGRKLERSWRPHGRLSASWPPR